MSPHRATHAASAEAHCLAPAGRFDELIEVTRRVPDVVRDEDGHLCQTGSVGLAGRALALFERGHRAAATEVLELFEGAPPPQGLVHLHWLALDMLRPLAGPRRTRQATAQVDRAGTTLAGRVHELRLNLQLSALARRVEHSRRADPAGQSCRVAHLRAAARAHGSLGTGGQARRLGRRRAGRVPSDPRCPRPGATWGALHGGPIAYRPTAVPRRRPARPPRRARRGTPRGDGRGDERQRGHRGG